MLTNRAESGGWGERFQHEYANSIAKR